MNDPETYTFRADFTTAIRQTDSGATYDSSATADDNTQAHMFNGRFNGTYPRHFTSVMGFGTAVEGGTLASRLAVRPVIKSASLDLFRLEGAGVSSPSGYLRMGAWTQSNFRSLPSTSLSGTYHDWSPIRSHVINGWSEGTWKNFVIDAQHIIDLKDGKGLMFSEVTSGYTTNGSTTNAYMSIAGKVGSGFGLDPHLTVTLDYA
jgi:hypothetical protein